MFKSQEKLIAEIHSEFDTAQDRLLDQANELLKTLEVPTETRVEQVADRLAKIGFTNTPTVQKASELRKKRSETKEKLVTSKEQAELIQYYKFNYPFLKFLTGKELNRICEKYSLIHAPVGNYIKEVPEKNLRDIEQAQILKNKDSLLYEEIQRLEKFRIEILGPDDGREVYINRNVGVPRLYYIKYNIIPGLERDIKNSVYAGLFIAAPKTHFNLEGLKNKSKFGWFKEEVKDPIVFRYVQGGIQVLSKWGLEGEDPSLVVEKFN